MEPILQTMATPYLLDTTSYANAFSPSNPKGDYLATYRFTNLVDQIPHFLGHYIASGNNAASVYNNIITGSTSENSGVSMVLASAKEQFNESALENIAGTPGKWYPVYAEPADWYKSIELDLTDMSLDPKTMTIQGVGDYTQIPAQNSTDNTWLLRVGDRTKPLSSNSVIEKITFKGLFVELIRPWINTNIFPMNQWSYAGFNNGSISSGQLDSNPGCLPLLTTDLIVGQKVAGSIILDQEDMNFINQSTTNDQAVNSGSSAQNNNQIFYGPLPISSNMIQSDSTQKDLLKEKLEDSGSSDDSGALFILGFISNLVPFCPNNPTTNNS